MNPFSYRNGELYAEDKPVAQIVQQVGTPCYIYSKNALLQQWQAFDQAFGEHPHLICFAVKANSNLAVLNTLAQAGAGFDIVSVGELHRVLLAGGDPGKVVFSGVAKRADEMREALAANIYCFNVESAAELELLNQVAAELDQPARVSIRVNPDVDANTHPYISTGLKENKFGIAIEDAVQVYERANALSHIDICGIDCHIGSQLTTVTPFLDALDRLLVQIDQLAEQGIQLRHLDIGGGLGVRYQNESPPLPQDYVSQLLAKLGNRNLKVIMEPGRAIAANAGILVTQVQLLKANAAKNFAVVDGAMNDLLRPALYSAWQDIIPVQQQSDQETHTYDVVGPVCETGDFLGKDRDLAIAPGDLLAVCSAGAYGFVMSSNYNTRNRACEIMVVDDQFYIVRQRETLEDQLKLESMVPDC